MEHSCNLHLLPFKRYIFTYFQTPWHVSLETSNYDWDRNSA